MIDYWLSEQGLTELRAAYRRALSVRDVYRTDAAILLGSGRTVADVADALPVDPQTALNYRNCRMGASHALYEDR